MLENLSKNDVMSINYNINDKTVEIKDNSKTHYWITNVSLITVIINCVIFPVFILEKKQMEWFGFIWIILGVLGIIALIHNLMKTSASDKLELTEINSLQEKQFFGRKKISLKLKNGKSRDLIAVKNEADIKAIKTFFCNLDIETV